MPLECVDTLDGVASVASPKRRISLDLFHCLENMHMQTIFETLYFLDVSQFHKS